MYTEALAYCKNCPECAIATGTGRIHKPPLCPIPVRRPFQIWGVDIMDLPKTEQGNRHVVVFQDLFTKWPMVYPVPDQKTIRIARLLTEEIVPFFGVPEALLSDRGTNLLSHLMTDVCKYLGVKKLNTTAYHPQCDGTIERFNRTLKSMLRKHAARFGLQWDKFLPGVLWAYRNTPHSSTGERPSFLLFGVDCRSPTEAAFLPVPECVPMDIPDYREELLLSLSSARELALQNIEKAQRRYKHQYDKRASQPTYKVGEWVLVRFPQEESGHNRKLSRPWHGPYRITERRDPDVTVTKVYFPSDGAIQVHQTRVCQCPSQFPAGYYWYGGRRRGPGRPPKWVDKLLSDGGGACIPDAEMPADPENSELQSAPTQTRDVVMDDSHSTGAVSDPVSTTKARDGGGASLPANRDAYVDMEETTLTGETELPDEGDFQTGDPDEEGLPVDERVDECVGTARTEEHPQMDVQVPEARTTRTRSRVNIRPPDWYM